MRIIILFLLFIILNISYSFSQTPQEAMKERQEKYQAELKEYNEGLVDTSHRFFFKTYDDYVSHKPVVGIKYTGKRKILIETESVLVLENDEYNYKKIKELKYWGFIDEWGQLERIFNNHCYFVLDTGTLCTYVKAIDGEMKTDKNGNESINWLSENSAGYKDYISETLTGDIEAFSEKKFEALTSSHPEIYQEFKTAELDPKIKDKRSQKTFKLQKYVMKFNQLK